LLTAFTGTSDPEVPVTVMPRTFTATYTLSEELKARLLSQPDNS